ncbi:MAG: hypothetical protein ACXAEX_20375 [Promethearchaeota archaeon]|jgi:hypothetical protein
MKNIKNYVAFCKRFHDYNLPKLRLKRLDERYRALYRKLFNINENDINKASFMVFLLFTFISIVFSMIFTSINFLIIILYSLILSLLISYKFSLILYSEITKKESLINSILYLIKIDFSLIQKTSKENSDGCLNFIELIKEYEIPISYRFKTIFRSILEGKPPEKELYKLVTPSNDFDNYIKILLINNFNKIIFSDFDENSLEKEFKIYLKQVQSKISILFFVGLFVPIGLCFLILFQLINVFLLIFFVPIFIILLNLIFRKFVRNQSYLIGLIDNFSSLERKKFKEFLIFLRSFANNLKSYISPETAFLKSFVQNKELITLLRELLTSLTTHLLNFSMSFSEILRMLKSELNALRYSIILDAINKSIDKNSYLTSKMIADIVNVINKHQKLESKLEVILKGEKFKIFFFIFLLPIITGAIAGFFPFFTLIIQNIELIGSNINFFFNNPMNLYNIFFIVLVLLTCISITNSYFLKVACIGRRFPIIIGSIIIFILTFLVSYINISSFI